MFRLLRISVVLELALGHVFNLWEGKLFWQLFPICVGGLLYSDYVWLNCGQRQGVQQIYLSLFRCSSFRMHWLEYNSWWKLEVLCFSISMWVFPVPFSVDMFVNSFPEYIKDSLISKNVKKKKCLICQKLATFYPWKRICFVKSNLYCTLNCLQRITHLKYKVLIEKSKVPKAPQSPG